jgi:hypothetical protein
MTRPDATVGLAIAQPGTRWPITADFQVGAAMYNQLAEAYGCFADCNVMASRYCCG